MSSAPSFYLLIFCQPFLRRCPPPSRLRYQRRFHLPTRFCERLLSVLASNILSVDSSIPPSILGFLRRMLNSSSGSGLEHRFPAWLCRTDAPLPVSFWLCPALLARCPRALRSCLPSPHRTLACVPVFQHSL